MFTLIQTLVDDYTDVRSRSEVHLTTVELARQQMNADASVLASADDVGFSRLASAPRKVTMSDDLLSPVSIPGLAASEGKSCIIDDRSDVRSATQAQSDETRVDVEFPSIMVVPFQYNGFLLVGSRETAAFTNDELDHLQVISALAALVDQIIGEAPPQSHSDKRVTEAASFLSHDAKNLLSVINGRLELAKEMPEEAEFDVVQNNLERLAELIDGTTALLKTGDHLTETEPTSIEETATLACESVDEDRATVHTEPLGQIIADRARLCQLFENLFRNAVDHAGPEVALWVGPLEADDGFFVEDDGAGIDPAEQDSLFELGYSTGDDHSGIGLTIVQWIADAHDWEIVVTESVLGGARFEFRNVELAEDSATPE